MTVKRKIILVLSILVSVFVTTWLYRFISGYSISPDKFINNSTISMSSSELIRLDDVIKVPTGIAYDSDSGTFWICDYEVADKFCYVYEFSKDFQFTGNEIAIVVNSEEEWNLQGITYDTKDKAFWIATGNKVIEVDKNGNVLNEIILDQLKNYKSNGLAYDKETDSLWILCYQKLLINCSKDGKVLKTIRCNIKDQDQLFFVDSSTLYFSAGADYNGDSNFIIEINVDEQEIKARYRLIDSFAIEGIYILGDKLYVVNDGTFHNAQIKDNYISCYDLFALK